MEEGKNAVKPWKCGQVAEKGRPDVVRESGPNPLMRACSSAGLEIEIKFVSNRQNWVFGISIRDQQPSSTNMLVQPGISCVPQQASHGLVPDPAARSLRTPRTTCERRYCPGLRPRNAGAIRAALSSASSAPSPLSEKLSTGVQCSCRTACIDEDELTENTFFAHTPVLACTVLDCAGRRKGFPSPILRTAHFTSGLKAVTTHALGFPEAETVQCWPWGIPHRWLDFSPPTNANRVRFPAALLPGISHDIHGDSSPFLLQPFHELSNGFWRRLTSPHPAIQLVPNMFYRVAVGALGGPVQSANIVVGVPLHSVRVHSVKTPQCWEHFIIQNVTIGLCVHATTDKHQRSYAEGLTTDGSLLGYAASVQSLLYSKTANYEAQDRKKALRETYEGVKQASCVTCRKEQGHHSPGIISKPRSRMAGPQESNPCPPECKSSGLPLRHLTRNEMMLPMSITPMMDQQQLFPLYVPTAYPSRDDVPFTTATVKLSFLTGT
ncbi:hypothetical protein PR048_002528 [Dryococelus australis]|uniref:Uncharacterized protein n=1 Tax=Dryococelus australis TaxID=614101 RepID=A0ABQ9IKH3_9NEOP|nr:hypothetical protein PR048_002528 [Dryococelus australis]